MQALKLLGQQLSKIWQQLGINQKVVIVGSGLLVVAGLAALIFWTSRTEYGLLFGRIDQIEVGKISTMLQESNVPYKIGPGGTSISIPQDQVATWRAQLLAKGLPKADGVGFEIFDKPTFGQSDFMQHANYARALQGELERTINKFEGVESAKVLISKSENRLVIDPDKKTTASVFITLRGMQQLEQRTVGAIRNFVANSVEGLKANNVSVVDNAGNSLAENNEEGSLSNLGSTQLGIIRTWEKYLADKVRSMLERYVGPDQVSVTVSAVLNTDSVTKTDEIYDPKLSGKVARSETIRDESTTSASPKPGGTPGTDVNADTSTNTVAVATINNETKKKDTQVEYALSRTTTNMVQLAGGLKVSSVTASVLINTNDNPNLNLVDLKTAVHTALGLPLELDQNVSLFGVHFNEKKVLKIDAEMKKERQTETIWRIGKSLLYVLLGVAALIGFWRLVKNSTEELLPTGIPVGQLVGGQLVYEAAMAQPGMALPSGMVQQTMAEQKVEEIMPQDEDVEELQAAKSKLVMDFGLGQQAPERITIEVLKQLIRENPAKMSQAARSWMTRKGKEAGEA
jgi:flagellar M-ring protein FliF